MDITQYPFPVKRGGWQGPELLINRMFLNLVTICTYHLFRTSLSYRIKIVVLRIQSVTMLVTIYFCNTYFTEIYDSKSIKKISELDLKVSRKTPDIGT